MKKRRASQMKKILITGKNSYIGNYLKEFLEAYPGDYSIDSISLRGKSWKSEDISSYDLVFHAVGLAHVRETEENKSSYYEINRDLTYEFAKFCKAAGVKRFIFLSSMSVYGLENGIIDENTLPKPNSHYGRSKLEAEDLLLELKDAGFKIAIVRPPMVYGKNTRGNYPRLSRLALKTPIFPDIENKRSMIYIENLCQFIRFLIDDEKDGIFFPQNEEYVNTTSMVKLIASLHNKKICFVRIFNPIIRLLNVAIINKMFGSLVYDKKLSSYHKNYNLRDFETSIRLTEE